MRTYSKEQVRQHEVRVRVRVRRWQCPPCWTECDVLYTFVTVPRIPRLTTKPEAGGRSVGAAPANQRARCSVNPAPHGSDPYFSTLTA
jgi:hypothetical protein